MIDIDLVLLTFPYCVDLTGLEPYLVVAADLPHSNGWIEMS